MLARFKEHLPLVDIITRQFLRTMGRHAAFDDLQSFGREGLLDAARRFDPARGVPFRSYANYRIRGAIVDGLRTLAHLPRRVHERLAAESAAAQYSEGAVEDLEATRRAMPTSESAESALSEHLAGMATAMALGIVATPGRPGTDELTSGAAPPNPEHALARAQLLELVKGAIAELPEQEATLVRRHYLEGDRFDHVAAELGLSKSWASRLHTRAIGRLGQRLRSQR